MSALVAATVTQTSPLRVQLDGATTDSLAFRNAAYTPTLNDRVVCERYGSSLFVHGEEAS